MLKWNNPSYILALPIISFRDIKMKTALAAQTELAWLYTGGKGLSLSGLAG